MKYEKHFRERISASGLKVTPQRLLVLSALIEMRNHPSADQLLEFIRRDNPHMGTGTVYNILDVLAGKGVIKRVSTDEGILRYDAIEEKHHHIICTDTGNVKDYFDQDLNKLLEDYFASHNIEGFEIEDISMHIAGKFNR